MSESSNYEARRYVSILFVTVCQDWELFYYRGGIHESLWSKGWAPLPGWEIPEVGKLGLGKRTNRGSINRNQPVVLKYNSPFLEEKGLRVTGQKSLAQFETWPFVGGEKNSMVHTTSWIRWHVQSEGLSQEGPTTVLCVRRWVMSKLMVPLSSYT